MTNLMFLNLSHNSLEGHLISFDNQNNLRRLILTNNELSVTIPGTLSAKFDKETFKFSTLGYNFVPGTTLTSLSGFQVRLQKNESIRLSTFFYYFTIIFYAYVFLNQPH